MKLLKIIIALAILLSPSCGTEIDCLDGCDKGEKGDQGERGNVGPTGPTGPRGTDGYTSLISMSRLDSGLNACDSDSGLLIRSGLDLDRSGVLDAGEVEALSTVCDGKDGNDGQNGTDGVDGVTSSYTVVDIIDPCGSEGSFDEVILVMANGELMAHYSHGNKQFLTILRDGSYETTDGTKCEFTINNGEINW